MAPAVIAALLTALLRCCYRVFHAVAPLRFQPRYAATVAAADISPKRESYAAAAMPLERAAATLRAHDLLRRR